MEAAKSEDLYEHRTARTRKDDTMDHLITDGSGIEAESQFRPAIAADGGLLP